MIFACWLGFGCTTFKPENIPAKHITFGNGGGVTGAVKEYILLENGQIFTRSTFGVTPVEIKKTKKSAAKKIYADYEAMKVAEVDFISPGNQYHYIQMNVDSTTNHRVVWGGAKGTPPEKVMGLYERLIALVKEKK